MIRSVIEYKINFDLQLSYSDSTSFEFNCPITIAFLLFSFQVQRFVSKKIF